MEDAWGKKDMSAFSGGAWETEDAFREGIPSANVCIDFPRTVSTQVMQGGIKNYLVERKEGELRGTSGISSEIGISSHLSGAVVLVFASNIHSKFPAQAFYIPVPYSTLQFNLWIPQLFTHYLASITIRLSVRHTIEFRVQHL